MKVAFWGNIKGKNSVTSNLASISVMGALLYKMKSVILENHFNVNNLEQIFLNFPENSLVKEENYYYNHIGMDYLLKHISSDIGIGTLIEKASLSFLNKSIYYIPQSHLVNPEILEYELNKVIIDLIHMLDDFSDITFMDTGYSNALSSKYILNEADLVVINLSQDKQILTHFFENHSSIREKAVYLIGSYNENSKYNLINISRKYHINKELIGVIPYNIEFKDALSEGTVIEFISRNYECKKTDNNYYFINELKRATGIVFENIFKKREAG